jgi:hypothetical protein
MLKNQITRLLIIMMAGIVSIYILLLINPMLYDSITPLYIIIVICAIVLGPGFAGGTGLIFPLVINLLFGIKPLLPYVVPVQIVSLSIYGIMTGYLYKIGDKNIIFSIVLGYIIANIVQILLIYLLIPDMFSLYIVENWISSWPGIVIQLIVIPFVCYILIKRKQKKEGY